MVGRTHPTGIDIALLVFPALYEIEAYLGIVLAFNLRRAEAGSLHQLVGQLQFIVELQRFGSLSKRNSLVEFPLRILGVLHGLLYRTQKDRTGGDHRNVHHAESLAGLLAHFEPRTPVSRLSLLGKDGNAHLVDTHGAGPHARPAPRRVARLPHPRLGAVDGLLRAYVIYLLGGTAQQGRLLDDARRPALHITVRNQLDPLGHLRGCLCPQNEGKTKCTYQQTLFYHIFRLNLPQR